MKNLTCVEKYIFLLFDLEIWISFLLRHNQVRKQWTQYTMDIKKKYILFSQEKYKSCFNETKLFINWHQTKHILQVIL